METGDGWLLRVRLPGGRITSETLAIAIAIGRDVGSGLFEVTSRANLQIRGVPVHRLDAAVAMALDGGLAGRTGTAERDALRAVVANPLAGHDATAVVGTDQVVDAVVDRLVDRVIGAVPAKFGIVIDDGGTWPLGHIDADVSAKAQPDGTWSVRRRGSIEPLGYATNLLDTLESAAQLCVDHGRMDRVAANVAEDDLRRRLGLRPAGGEHSPATALPREDRIIGIVPHPDSDAVNIVVAPFLGRVEGATLATIGVLATEHAAALRLTPDRSFAFCGVARSVAASLQTALRDLGLVVATDDARATISACVGSAGCSWAHADTRCAAERLAGTGDGRRVHLSACAKGCGAPARVRHLVADHTGNFR